MLSTVLLAALGGCGGGSGGGDSGGVVSVPAPAPTPTPVPTPTPSSTPTPAPTGATIQPLGTPRIIVSDGPTITNLKNQLSANAPAATRFKQSVDLQVANSNIYGMEAWHVALMGQVTGQANYCTYAVAKTDAYVASEEALIAANKTPVVAGDSYLEVGGYVGNLAMVYDWCRGSMTAAQRTRWKDFGNQAVWNVWNPAQAKWGGRTVPWSGWSVDNPSNNYYYSFLKATMLLGLATYGENDMAGGWLTQFRTTKIENQLLPVFNADLTGGGSREGTGYGVAMRDLFQLYDWWERSTGENLAGRTPHTLASLPWMVHAIVPTLDRITPTGDHARDSKALLFDYHRDYLQKLATLYPDERISGVVKTLLGQSSVKEMSQHFMRYSDYLYGLVAITPRPLTELSTAYWGSGTGSFSMRTDWTTSAAYANFICGPYTESHAHQDRGSFVLFKGNWLAYDANIDSHSGLSQDQKYHNTARFETSGGTAIGQAFNASCAMAALANTANWAYALADLTPMYKSGVTKSEREFVFVKPATFVVYDRARTTDANARRIFTMNFPKAPTIAGNLTSLVIGASRFDMLRIVPATGTPTTTLWKSANATDFATSTAARVDLAEAGAGGSSEFLHVIGLDGAVAQAVAANAAGQTGTAITLADGRVVTLRFNQNSRGGTIEIKSAGGAVLESRALPTGVEAPPIYAN
ncbi:hypothetical protein P6144_17520 [Sphingomonas sp. HITSZ_GF]|uniref:hypothetical protein n=1 Tax=Sphingomonas sp. HITSZ_GF TaxID=3037247 RepID=UPI00240D2279|nr:hypothetical protein [Sphingomonas sp. HITSZ_GF]MDG2535465.1 hypothetical protein [Sphingomonas sp. HITSZ_GF]